MQDLQPVLPLRLLIQVVSAVQQKQLSSLPESLDMSCTSSMVSSQEHAVRLYSVLAIGPGSENMEASVGIMMKPNSFAICPRLCRRRHSSVTLPLPIGALSGGGGGMCGSAPSTVMPPIAKFSLPSPPIALSVPSNNDMNSGSPFFSLLISTQMNTPKPMATKTSTKTKAFRKGFVLFSSQCWPDHCPLASLSQSHVPSACAVPWPEQVSDVESVNDLPTKSTQAVGSTHMPINE
jgi:hypothetical protein